MKLTTHQTKAVKEAIDFLYKENKLLIEGSAGVGKTTIALHIIEGLKCPEHKKVICSASTNKAIEVLREKVGNNKGISFNTIHKVLGIKEKLDEVTGKRGFTEPCAEISDKIFILLIDEASMLSKEIIDAIEAFPKWSKVKIIFMGDEKQLPPVNEVSSKVFKMGYKSIRLKEIIRQKKNSNIIKLSENIDNIFDPKYYEGDVSAIFSIKEVIQILAKNDDVKFLAWRNETVDKVNKMARDLKYSTDKQLHFGERVLLNSGNSDFFNNEEVIIINIKHINANFPLYLKKNGTMQRGNVSYFKVKVKSVLRSFRQGEIYVIDNSNYNLFSACKKSIKEAVKTNIAVWKDYYSFIDKFMTVSYAYAITVHKSQGSTYLKTIIDIGDLLMNKNKIEQKKLIYTAITRAKDHLKVYHEN